MIDEEVRKIIDEQYEVALGILNNKRGSIEKAVTVLLDKEKITGDELQEIIDNVSSTKEVAASNQD